MENKERITEIVFILDRSGSMAGLESDTIGGFNGFIERQKKEEGKAFLTTVLFDDGYELLHDRQLLSNVKLLTEKDYYVRGCTALYDAMGKTIKHIANIHRYARKEDRPLKTIVVITTDGMENASREFRAEDIKKLVKAKQKRGWEFVFLGANMDAIAAAGSVGINASHAVKYCCDEKGTELNFEAVGRAFSAIRRMACMCMEPNNFREADCLDESWKAEIEEYEKKKS